MTLFGNDEVKATKPRKYGSQFGDDQLRGLAVRAYGGIANTWPREKLERMLEAADVVRKHANKR